MTRTATPTEITPGAAPETGATATPASPCEDPTGLDTQPDVPRSIVPPGLPAESPDGRCNAFEAGRQRAGQPDQFVSADGLSRAVRLLVSQALAGLAD